mmetsp:Transcript_4028/g.10176  ORF Transcript_4028/g.10176 Transcript_4028/m.10176 type:complete len:88 (-) Transcript_4028:58-321(-)
MYSDVSEARMSSPVAGLDLPAAMVSPQEHGIRAHVHNRFNALLGRISWQVAEECMAPSEASLTHRSLPAATQSDSLLECGSIPSTLK